MGPPTYLAPPTVAGTAALCNARPMPRPRREPSPDAIAKTVTDRDPSPVGMPELAAITLRLALPRPVLERLRARAIRETRKLEAIIRELLEDGAAK